MRAAEYWIRPYLPGREDNGLDAEAMRGLYDRMEAQGLARSVFAPGAVHGREDFLALCREPGAAACAMGRGDETLALVWLNGFEGRAANLHFCVFREGWPESVAIGRFTLDALLNSRGPGRTPPLDLLLGATPASNRAARLYVRKVGFKVLGFIPHRFVNIHTGATEAGMVSFATRETLKEVL
jgi:hypothetical protein